MQSTMTGEVVWAEWRWVMLVSLLLVLLAFSPFLFVAQAGGQGADWRFMGAVHNPSDTAAYLSKVAQGSTGLWLVHLLHTPEPHLSALIHPVYSWLGQLSRVTRFPPVTLFHFARLCAAFLMYLAIYQMAANIWVRVRTRRIFFGLAAVASGLGWLNAILSGSVQSSDLSVPAAYPFFGTLASVHEPLAIATLALMTSVLIAAFRPGAMHDPGVENGGGVLVMTSVLLAFLLPEAFVPLSAAMIVSALIAGKGDRKLLLRGLRWVAWTLIPMLPIGTYTLLVIAGNPTINNWHSQRVSPSPDLFVLLIGLGLPFVLALPGIWRAIRAFEADGDRLMLLWLGAMLLGRYLPIELGQFALTGLMLPIAYFATRAVEDQWLAMLRRRDRRWAYSLALPLLGLSNLFVLFVPVVPYLHARAYGTAALEPEYAAAFQWLYSQTEPRSVILAAPDVSLWVPFWTGARSWYGHPAETTQAAQRRQQVLSFYRATDAAQCEALLDVQRSPRGEYIVDYVIYGPREQRLGSSACLDDLRFVASFGRVQVFRTRLPR